MAPNYLLIFLLFGSTSFANPACEWEASGLGKAGRAFVGVVKRALESGDLQAEQLRALIQNSRAYNPVPVGRTLTNLSIRKGIQRALRRMEPAEWPFATAEVARILERKAQEKASSGDASVETQNVFALQSARFELPPQARFIDKIVSSKGEIFVHYTENDKPMVIAVKSGNKFQISDFGVRQFAFFETSDGEVLMSFLAMKQIAHVRRARDNGSLFEQSLSHVAELGRCFGKDMIEHSLFERNGRLTFAVYYPTPTKVHDIFDRPAVLIDVESKERTVWQIPISQLDVKISVNGRLYAVGVGSIPGKVYSFGYDLSDGTRMFFNEYKDYHPINSMHPILFFTPEGDPKMHAQSGGASGTLYEVGHGTDLFDLDKMVSAHLVSSYLDVNGKLQYATSGHDRGGRVLFYGALGKLETLKFPDGLNFLHHRVNMVRGPRGLVAFIWHTDGNNTFELNDFSGLGWIKMPVDLDVMEVGAPFYDPAQKAILIFLKIRDGSTKLYQIYGREARI